jgi:hypothetical protein
VRVTVEGAAPIELEVLLREMPEGIASVPAGVPGMPVLSLPGWRTVTGALK